MRKSPSAGEKLQNKTCDWDLFALHNSFSVSCLLQKLGNLHSILTFTFFLHDIDGTIIIRLTTPDYRCMNSNIQSST